LHEKLSKAQKFQDALRVRRVADRRVEVRHLVEEAVGADGGIDRCRTASRSGEYAEWPPYGVIVAPMTRRPRAGR